VHTLPPISKSNICIFAILSYQTGSAEPLPNQVDCDICQDISYKLEECSSDDCNNQVCADHLCSTCKSCEHCCDCQEEEESVTSTSSEVDADENDSSGEEGDEEEDEDLLQDMIDQYEHAGRAEPTKPQNAGIKCQVTRVINRTPKTFNTSGTYGTAIAPYLVACGIIFSLDLAYDGGGGGQGGTVNCFFLSTQIEELHLSDVNTLRQVLESDPNNVELRSLIRRDDIDGVWDMMTKVIDNLTSERSKRGRFYNITLLNDTISNYTAIRDAIEAGDELPSFLWANQAETQFDSSELVSFVKDPKKMNSRMEMFALRHFLCDNDKLPLRFNPRGALTLESNFERIEKRAEHGARSEFELLFYDSDYAARFKLYLTPAERNNPNDIPIERKKERCLAFLHGEGYVAKHFTPITLVPSEDFSLNKLNASEEEKKVFWERMIPELFKNEKRVKALLKQREVEVSCVCLFDTYDESQPYVLSISHFA